MHTTRLGRSLTRATMRWPRSRRQRVHQESISAPAVRPLRGGDFSVRGFNLRPLPDVFEMIGFGGQGLALVVAHPEIGLDAGAGAPRIVRDEADFHLDFEG